LTRFFDRLGGLFERIREAVAALPVENAVIDGEAVLLRADGSFYFEGLRSREGLDRSTSRVSRSL
jgi:ATP-dependent DNA ligase